MIRILLTCYFGLLCLAPSMFAVERIITFDLDATEVSFHVPATGHDVEGQLQLSEGELRLDSQSSKASGMLKLALKSARTGNEKRDATMHKKVFETEKFPWIVFEPSRFEGTLPADGSGEVEIFGTISIHGDEHPLSMAAKFTLDGETFDAETTFSVPYVEWGMKNPSLLFLRVGKVVEVSVRARGPLH